MKNFFRIATIVIGLAIIIGGFLLFQDKFEGRVLVLDIVMACGLFCSAALYIIFPLIDREDEEGKDVGMLGINLKLLGYCSIVSVAIIALGFAFDVPFEYQLLAQMVVLLLVCLGKFLSLHSGEQVARVHHAEQSQMAGKHSIREAAMKLLSTAEINGLGDADLLGQIRALAEDTRYVIPSSNNAATDLDATFCRDAATATRLLNHPESAEQLRQLIGRLERTLMQRKLY